jgi:arginyl-tRNA synthetase
LQNVYQPKTMNFFKAFLETIHAEVHGLCASGTLPAALIPDLSRVTVEPPREPQHGDLATNAAMVLAKGAGMPPRALAEKLLPRLLAHPDVASGAMAGPGFINLTLKPAFWQDQLRNVLRAGTAWGDSTLGHRAVGQRTRVNVEYVSANPTGPLHVGHARGAVFGDVLSSLLAKTGHDVTREYYINDAGAQVDVLARSTYLRYREALGEDIGGIPEGLYPGEYLKPVGAAIAASDGPRWRDAPETDWLPVFRSRAVAAMLDLIREDLAALGITHDVFVSERALLDSGAVDTAMAALDAQGLLYTGTLEPPKGQLPDDWEAREQRLFRSSQFGDDTDRPIQKSDGSWTYFAGDIACHADKLRRGFDHLINVWGADHGGYVKRLRAAVQALDPATPQRPIDNLFDVKLIQLVHLFKEGQPYKMSKRAGTFVTARDIVEEVGKDALRFMMLTRRNDATLEFDVARVLEQSRDNPVFYVQYAHARTHSVFRQAGESLPELDLTPAVLAGADLASLDDPAELELLRLLAGWPRQVELAAVAHEPHRLSFAMMEIAASFHSLWNKGREQTELRFIERDDLARTQARLALVKGVQVVLASGFLVLGVTPVEELR